MFPVRQGREVNAQEKRCYSTEETALWQDRRPKQMLDKCWNKDCLRLQGIIMEQSGQSLRQALRRQARKERDALSAAQRARASAVICAQLCSLPETAAAQSLFVYCAFRSEVETAPLWPLLQGQGKQLCVPLTLPTSREMLPLVLDDPAELRPGAFGIPEPLYREERVFPADRLDMVILPGLLFDRAGNRLGYGGGFYDRFLANRASQALRVGLAFACQLADAPVRLPVAAHDMPLDILITEQETWRFPRQTAKPGP